MAKDNQNLFLGVNGGMTKSTFILINEKEEEVLKKWQVLEFKNYWQKSFLRLKK
jgi:hypothetical protein